jgi:RimJ/RimL family protein N-acetyltransferase
MWELPTLDTMRLILRSLSIEDAPVYKQLLQDPEIAMMGLGIHYPYQEGDAERIIQRAINGPEQNRYTWGIVIKKTDELIGLYTLGITPEHKHGELGYWIGKKYWNHGYTTEATQNVLRAGFDYFDLNRIFARSFSNNPASTRVMEKAGMVYEGNMRQHLWHELSGEFKDLLIYSMLRTEYVQL